MWSIGWIRIDKNYFIFYWKGFLYIYLETCDKYKSPCFDLWILIITLKYWLDHLGSHKIVFSCMQNEKRYREVNSVQNVKWLYNRVWIINKNWQSWTWDCNLNIFFWIQYLCDWLWTKTPLTNYLICTNHLVYNPW